MRKPVTDHVSDSLPDPLQGQIQPLATEPCSDERSRRLDDTAKSLNELGLEASRLADRIQLGSDAKAQIARLQTRGVHSLNRENGIRIPDAEDLVQEASVTLWRSLGTGHFDANYSLEVKFWEFLGYRKKDYFRKHGRQPLPVDDIESFVEDLQDHREAMNEKIVDLRDLLARLPLITILNDKERSAISYLLEGLSPSEMAAEDGRTPDTWRKRIRSAHNKIKIYLKEDDDGS